MKRENQITLIAATVALLGAAPAFAQSGEAAQVIFTNDKLTVIDARGVERVAKQGDFIQPGERLITPPGVVGQIKLPDGTLLGARPGTDIKLDSIVKALGKNVVTLNDGNLRVVNVEPPKGPKPMPMDVISPISTLQIQAGDGEAIHLKPGNRQKVDPGTYNRLQQGTAVVRTDKGELPLPPMQPVFAPKEGVPMVPIATLPTTLVKLETVALRTPPLLSSLPVLQPPSVGALGPLPSIGMNTPLLSGSVIKPGGGTAPLAGTSNVVFSQTLTPMASAINPQTLATATIIKPPPPPPPPPPKVITCKTCLIIKK